MGGVEEPQKALPSHSHSRRKGASRLPLCAVRGWDGHTHTQLDPESVVEAGGACASPTLDLAEKRHEGALLVSVCFACCWWLSW